jgi:ATP-dependent Clp protease ATP-binding subunit ClpB
LPAGRRASSKKRAPARRRSSQRLPQAVQRLPRVSGGGAQAGQVYVSPRVNEILNSAEAEARRMKDEFVSVEHVLLALAEVKDVSST